MSETNDQSPPPDDQGADLDAETEQKRLDDLGDRIEAARHDAGEDLEPGHAGRMFADESTERLARNDEAARGDAEAP
ncbi:MAG: hypothetical protein ACR2MB_05595 [Acidimicrobiales bacterium]